MGGAGEAVDTGMGASAIRIDRPPERHPRLLRAPGSAPTWRAPRRNGCRGPRARRRCGPPPARGSRAGSRRSSSLDLSAHPSARTHVRICGDGTRSASHAPGLARMQPRARDALTLPTASPPAAAARRGRGARTGRSPARCRAPAGRRGHGQRQRRPQQRGLDVGRHVVGALERVGPVARRPRARRRENQDSKSRRTSGLAFSFSVSEAEVCWINRCSRPTSTSPSSGTAATHLAGDEVEAAWAGFELDVVLCPHWRDR